VFPRDCISARWQRADPVSDLLDFYSEKGTDFNGRSLSSILAYTDEDLEHIHDYIQWLFPLPEPSRFVLHAPILRPKDIHKFKSNPVLRSNMQRSWYRMSRFYSGDRQWISFRNHNFMRITRILKSLSLCGLNEDAELFLVWLKGLPAHNLEVIGFSMSFWEAAVAEPSR